MKSKSLQLAWNTADQAWRQNSLLQRIYPDLQCFLEHCWIALNGEAWDQAVATVIAEEAADLEELIQARMRLCLADAPSAPYI